MMRHSTSASAAAARTLATMRAQVSASSWAQLILATFIPAASISSTNTPLSAASVGRVTMMLTSRVQRPEHGFDRTQHITLGVGEGIEAEAAQRGAQSRCIRLAHFEIMYEVTCAFLEFRIYAGQVFSIICFKRDRPVVDVQQIPDLPDIGVLVHACMIIGGEH